MRPRPTKLLWSPWRHPAATATTTLFRLTSRLLHEQRDLRETKPVTIARGEGGRCWLPLQHSRVNKMILEV
ncbi:hypothetical protein BDZ90DRAFT_234707 [Jaminaea rosea]|uniref:Uncharacterized protein n=1 Tax=Jaminaea rosea TaxID=1569628 RepID=A0A316UIR3_9BASI|nr:hypothetical protein BDZ90DRAFT_234707 [Jaminaea rosea]PWN24758.1 hypothetical protein BDZ90DRAFT_234707 [Jaminaea rosea]